MVFARRQEFLSVVIYGPAQADSASQSRTGLTAELFAMATQANEPHAGFAGVMRGHQVCVVSTEYR